MITTAGLAKALENCNRALLRMGGNGSAETEFATAPKVKGTVANDPASHSQVSM